MSAYLLKDYSYFTKYKIQLPSDTLKQILIGFGIYVSGLQCSFCLVIFSKLASSPFFQGRLKCRYRQRTVNTAKHMRRNGS